MITVLEQENLFALWMGKDSSVFWNYWKCLFCDDFLLLIW